MSFTPSNVLQRALETGNMRDIACALIGYIDADPKFWTNDFDMALKYVLSEGGVSESQLFKEFDPSLRFDDDPQNWDVDYASYARLFLQKNFCKKRIDHVKAIALHEFGPKPASMQQDRTRTQGETSKNQQARPEGRAQRSNPKSHTNANSKAIAIGIVAVLIIVVAIVVVANILR